MLLARRCLGPCGYERLSSYFCAELFLLFRLSAIRALFLQKGLFSLIELEIHLVAILLVVTKIRPFFFHTSDAQYQVVRLALLVVIRVKQGSHIKD